ncbi:MAG: hypothetical protein RR494_10930 [Vagococcus sp.]|uniref:hypothetical protein n=1 Tax=Vagococcus TaxID=2737 RepID=UPI002FCAAD11
MNNMKIYVSLLGAFIFSIVGMGLLNLLLNESFFEKSTLIGAIVGTATMSFFVLREQRKKSKN